MILMLLSRSLSLVSSLVYTTFFGNTLKLNIYSYAIQFPVIVFNSFGTALATIVIPVFAGYIGKGDKKRAFAFANNVISISIAVATGLTVAGIFLAPVFPRFTEFKDNGYGFAVKALRIMFPVMIFYALNYILQGILQSFEKFNMPAFVSVPSSLTVILYVLFLGGRFGVEGLIVATFIGLSLQAVVLIPPVLKTEYRYRPSFDFKNEDIKRSVKMMIPIIIGTSAYQFNMFFNITIVANYENAVTITTIVQKLILYAVLAFIYSVTAVVYPRLTVLAANNNINEFKTSLNKVIRFLIYLLIPATAGFVVMRYKLFDLLVGWGKITSSEVNFAASLLAIFAAGIIGIGIKEVVDRAFYSLNDTKKPAYNGIIIMVVNVVCVLSLKPLLGVYSVPLGYSASILLGAAALIFMLRQKIGAMGGRKILNTVFKTTASSVIMLAAVIPLNSFFGRYMFEFELMDKLIKLIIPAATGSVVYFISTWFLKVEETKIIISKITGKIRKMKFN